MEVLQGTKYKHKGTEYTVCVCVCVCVRERERERGWVYVHIINREEFGGAT